MMRAGIILGLVLVGCSSPASYPHHETFMVTKAMRLYARESSSIGAMRESLDYIEGWHREQDTGIAESLNAGLDAAAIDVIEDQLGCKLPRELRALWAWRNGHPDTATAQWLVWYHQLMPAEEALRQYRYLRSEPIFAWDASWFPVMFFQEEWYFVECSETTVDASPLMYYFTESGPHEAYRSLTSYFATAREAMKSGGVYIEGEDSEVFRDVRAVAAAHQRFNAGIQFPYYVPE